MNGPIYSPTIEHPARALYEGAAGPVLLGTDGGGYPYGVTPEGVLVTLPLVSDAIVASMGQPPSWDEHARAEWEPKGFAKLTAAERRAIGYSRAAWAWNLAIARSVTRTGEIPRGVRRVPAPASAGAVLGLAPLPAAGSYLRALDDWMKAHGTAGLSSASWTQIPAALGATVAALATGGASARAGVLPGAPIIGGASTIDPDTLPRGRRTPFGGTGAPGKAPELPGARPPRVPLVPDETTERRSRRGAVIVAVLAAGAAALLGG